MGVKYIINRITSGDDELVLNYTKRTAEVDGILQFMQNKSKKLMGKLEDENIMLNPNDILYIEKVDEKTFAYTLKHVIQLNIGLAQVLEVLNDVKYFRCSKSMIVNIDKVERLKSLSSNRIDATMQGGEHILISRTYASEFRRILKGGYSNE